MKSFKHFLAEASYKDTEASLKKKYTSMSIMMAKWRAIHAKHSKERFASFDISAEHGSVMFTDNPLYIYDDMLDGNGELELKVTEAPAVYLQTKKLTSFKNFPETLTGIGVIHQFYTTGKLPLITSLEGIPRDVTGDLDLWDLDNLSYSQVDKYIDKVGWLSVSEKYKGPLLSVLKIKEIQGFYFQNSQHPLSKIINYHLNNGRNISACQTELMKNGFKEYAKL